MKNNILTGSLYTAGILLPQITFAEIQNDKVSPDRPNIIFILADDMGWRFILLRQSICKNT